MFISKKKYKKLEKRVADLEVQVQSQQKEMKISIEPKKLKEIIDGVIHQDEPLAIHDMT